MISANGFGLPEQRQAQLYIQPHDGMGDHLICNALYRKLATLHNHISLFVKPSLCESVGFMLRDVGNIEIVRRAEWNTIPSDRPLLGLGLYEDGPVRWGWVMGRHNCTWDHTFYWQCGFDASLKWDGFKMERDLEREKAFMESLKLGDEPYLVFMSRGSDDTERIRTADMGTRLRKIEMKPTLTQNIFDWISVLEGAKEIHTIDSSLKWLAEFFPLKAKLFYHTLWKPRQNPPNPHGTRKEWVIR